MRQKKWFLVLLIGLLFSGCAKPQQPESPSSSSAEQSIIDQAPSVEDSTLLDPLLEDYLANPDVFETPTREYGESVSHLQLDADFVARILYPTGDVAALDSAVAKWVTDTTAYYHSEVSAGSTADESAELTVDYSSYIVNETLVGVKLSGIFDQPYLAHPIDVSASFNANMETGQLLTLDDVLLPGGEEALRNMVVAQAEIEAELVDDGLLDHWLLTHDGLEITLIRGDYLPMSDGTVTLCYPYEELEGIFAVPDTSVPAPEQPDAPEPSPMPEGEEKSPVQMIDPAKPMLALTFDDGPSAHTARLLDAFAAHGGKGTFFVVGNMLDNRPDVLRRMAEEGHEIGGHSWNHRQLTKLSEEELTDQLMSTRAKIYDIAGVDATTMRPPYGSYNKQVESVCAELGIAIINWSVDTLDWKHKNADAVYREVVDQARDGAIILCHDLHKTTVDAMERAIPALIAEGYQLVTVSELLTSTGDSITPGRVYFKR